MPNDAYAAAGQTLPDRSESSANSGNKAEKPQEQDDLLLDHPDKRPEKAVFKTIFGDGDNSSSSSDSDDSPDREQAHQVDRSHTLVPHGGGRPMNVQHSASNDIRSRHSTSTNSHSKRQQGYANFWRCFARSNL